MPSKSGFNSPAPSKSGLFSPRLSKPGSASLGVLPSALAFAPASASATLLPFVPAFAPSTLLPFMPVFAPASAPATLLPFVSAFAPSTLLLLPLPFTVFLFAPGSVTATLSPSALPPTPVTLLLFVSLSVSGWTRLPSPSRVVSGKFAVPVGASAGLFLNLEAIAAPAAVDIEPTLLAITSSPPPSAAKPMNA